MCVCERGAKSVRLMTKPHFDPLEGHVSVLVSRVAMAICQLSSRWTARLTKRTVRRTREIEDGPMEGGAVGALVVWLKVGEVRGGGSILSSFKCDSHQKASATSH